MLKVGVLGAGHLGKIHLRLLNQSEKYELVGFFDPFEENANKVAAEFGYKKFDSIESLIATVDVVDIVTPTIQHFECAKMVIEAGKHIFIEKPIATTVPEAEEIDVEIKNEEIRVDVYRSSGPGGQSVNTTDSAVRITHIPTGIVVSCQNEKSQLQNKESALRILRARLLADAQEKAEAAAMAERKSQVRTVDRSERIRTYNYPENRLSDHRVNYKSNNLDSVLNGELDDVVQALLDADKAAKLSSTD